MSELVLRNRQRVRRINLRLLRRMIRWLLEDLLSIGSYEVCFHLIGQSEITHLNQTFLRQAGSTDVIAFDYSVATEGSDRGKTNAKSELSHVGFHRRIYGEVFVCVDEAVRQARRFRTSWQSELLRYVIHGVLHLHGFDDSRPAARRKMKREENRLLRILVFRFPLSRLLRKPTIHP